MNHRTEKGFGMVSNVATRDPELTLREKGLYAYLCTYADKATNQTFVSVNRMANECGISQSSVSRILDKLIKKNVIKRTFQGKGLPLITLLLK